MKQIASRDNPFFKQLKRLAQSSRERSKAGLTLLDGVHLITAYEAALGPLTTLVVSQSALAQDEIARFVAGRELTVLSDALFREAGVVDTPAGVMALAPMPAEPSPDPAVDSIVLDGIQDPGNLGTLLRTAAAAGFRQAILSADTAGAWSPRVLRAGQGAHFSLSIVQGVEITDFLSAYRGTVAVTQLAESVSLFAAPLGDPIAWVFGSEGQGVKPATLALAGVKVRIPMPGGTESLNVGAAAAVCLFETVRRRLPI